jgi:hypothetical protein
VFEESAKKKQQRERDTKKSETRMMMREAHVIFFFSSLTHDKTFEEMCKICKTLNRKESGEQPLVFFFFWISFVPNLPKKRGERDIREKD